MFPYHGMKPRGRFTVVGDDHTHLGIGCEIEEMSFNDSRRYADNIEFGGSDKRIENVHVSHFAEIVDVIREM